LLPTEELGVPSYKLMKVIICTEVRTQHKLRDKTNKEIKTNGRTKGDSIKDAERYTGK
jgi:hypothetical protein